MKIQVLGEKKRRKVEILDDIQGGSLMKRALGTITTESKDSLGNEYKN